MKNSIIIKIMVGIGVLFALLVGIFIIKKNERIIDNINTKLKNLM